MAANNKGKTIRNIFEQDLFEVKTNRLIFEKMDTKIDEKISQAEFRIALGKAVGKDKANAMIRAGAYIRNEGGGGIVNVAFHGAHSLASHGTSSPYGIPAMIKNIYNIFKAPIVYLYRLIKKPAALVDHVAEAEQFLKDVDININQMQSAELKKLDKKFRQERMEQIYRDIEATEALKTVTVGFPTREQEVTTPKIAPAFPTDDKGGQFTDYRNPSGKAPESKEFAHENNLMTEKSGRNSPDSVTFTNENENSKKNSGRPSFDKEIEIRDNDRDDRYNSTPTQ